MSQVTKSFLEVYLFVYLYMLKHMYIRNINLHVCKQLSRRERTALLWKLILKRSHGVISTNALLKYTTYIFFLNCLDKILFPTQLYCLFEILMKFFNAFKIYRKTSELKIKRLVSISLFTDYLIIGNRDF